MEVKILQCTPINHPFPILSWAIRFIQRTDYSHYAIQYNSWVLDATSKGVQYVPDYEYFNHYKTVNSFDVELNTTFINFYEWICKYIDTKYGFFQIIGLLLKILKLTKVNPFGRDDKAIICNELVLLMLKDLRGLELGDSDNYDLVETEKIIRGLEDVCIN